MISLVTNAMRSYYDITDYTLCSVHYIPSLGKRKSKLQRAISSHLSEWLSSKSQQTTSAVRTWRKRNPSALLVGMQTGAATVEHSMELPQKITNGITTKPSDSTSEILN